MKRVFKYPLAMDDLQELQLPRGAEILHVANQAGYTVLWALVPVASVPTERRLIRIAGTGHPIDDAVPLKHISTFEYGIGLIFHAFEVLS